MRLFLFNRQREFDVGGRESVESLSLLMSYVRLSKEVFFFCERLLCSLLPLFLAYTYISLCRVGEK